MTTPTSAEGTFHLSVTEFKKGQFEKSLEHVNQAIALGLTTQTAYETRAAVLEKLGRVSDALKDARKVIELAPTSPQGYVRSCRLFLQVSRAQSASRMLQMARERTPEDDSKRMERLAVLQTQVDDALKKQELQENRKRCHVAKLPYDVLSEVMMIAVFSGKSHQSKVSGVCKSWRSAALSTSSLWRVLRIHPKNPLEQMRLWTHRSSSKNSLRAVTELHLPRLARQFDTSALLRQWFSSPRIAKDPSTPIGLLADWLPIEALTLLPTLMTPGLAHIVCREADAPFACSPLIARCQILGTRLGILELGKIDTIEIEDLPDCSALRICRLRQIAITWPFTRLLRFLDHFSQVEELELSFERNGREDRVDDSPDHQRKLIYSNLRRLSLAGTGHWTNALPQISTPKLEFLDLGRTPLDVGQLLSQQWAQFGAPPLRELRLNRCGVGKQASSLCTILLSLPQLEVLHVTGCGDDFNPAVRLLAGRSSIASSTEPRPLPCPNLQHVDFSRSASLSGSSIRDMVRAHLGMTTTPSISPSVEGPPPKRSDERPLVGIDPITSSTHPIQTLIIDGCPNIQSEVLPWLRKSVPHFSCVYESKNASKKVAVAPKGYVLF
ncbi:hypothetical protein DL93DRAFT_2164414 [Clavulina sp. PMI_390]|nr:hypothetical protein DL93DRAFT_2164414 [Clavulina sp. PMI_390]